MKRSGRKSAAQTPAPRKEQIYGSKKNPKGSAASKKSAASINLSESIVKTLSDKRAKFIKEHPNQSVSLATLKAVMRRGMGAYSSSHRPTITGGAPNSRQAWGFARVNKFLKKKAGQKVKAAYVQDDDLMEKGGEIRLLAPNGKPSNLTLEQYKLVRTSEFKSWFGDWENDPQNASKVVDENGEPLVVYHGTNSDFTIFKADKPTIAAYGQGFYFTNDKNFASNYARGEKSKILNLFLNAKKIFYIDDDELPIGYEKYSNMADNKGTSRDFTRKIISNGYDCVYAKNRYNENELVVFQPNQIKLADGSNTTFDAENPDIRFNVGGQMKNSIALPDTYSDYENLKPILAKQGYEIKKIEMDLPVGKLAKGMSLSEVAAKHGLKADDLRSELKMGIKREMEHTDEPEYARAIAMDHLFEDAKYYTKMKQMGGIDGHYSEISKTFAEGGEIDPIFSFNTPTGEKSRLSYLQQVLVRTKSFKEFFGDWESAAKNFLRDNKSNFDKHYANVSKVLDYVTLEPKVVYHGTRTQDEFFRFDVTKEKGVGRPYGYFAHNLEYSENFTQFSQRSSGAKPYLYKCFINIRKPFYATTSEYWMKMRDADQWKDIIAGTIIYDKLKTIAKDDTTQDIRNAIESQIGSYIEKSYQGQRAPFWRLMAADIEKDFKYFIMAYGYDGIFYGEEIRDGYDPEKPSEYTQAVTIFDSKQVKLADGRNLNFNPLIDDIRYDEGGMTEDDEIPQNHFDMNKKAKLGMLITGEKYEVGGTVVTKHGSTNDGKKGGYFKGRSHADGGIKAINKDTGQLIEVEGEEVIITKDAVNDTEKREFEGEMLTNREILSRINQSGGGVAFEDGGEIHGSSCGCSGKKYKFGGEMLEDFNIIRLMSKPQKTISTSFSNAREFADLLVKKMQ